MFTSMPLVGGEPRCQRLFVFFFMGCIFHAVRKYITLDWRYAVILLLGVLIFRVDAPNYFSFYSYLAFPYLVLYAAYGLPYVKNLNEIGDFSYGIYIYMDGSAII